MAAAIAAERAVTTASSGASAYQGILLGTNSAFLKIPFRLADAASNAARRCDAAAGLTAQVWGTEYFLCGCMRLAVPAVTAPGPSSDESERLVREGWSGLTSPVVQSDLATAAGVERAAWAVKGGNWGAMSAVEIRIPRLGVVADAAHRLLPGDAWPRDVAFFLGGIVRLAVAAITTPAATQADLDANARVGL